MKQQSFFTRDSMGQLGGRVVHVPNPYRIELVNLACNSYGHLIARGETLTSGQFADKIRAAYDCTEPHNFEVVRALGELM
jgi:hypothetical protein